MITLNFSVDDQLLTRTDENTVAANSHLVHVCEFAFSSEWDGRGKVATFKKRDLMLSVILDDDACTIPPEILQSENKIDVFELSVCGADGNSTITSTVVKVPILAGTWDVMSTEITPTMFEQIMAKIEEIEENELTIEDVNNAIEEYFEEHPDLGLNPAEVFNAITRSGLINLTPNYVDYTDGLEKTDTAAGVNYYVIAPGHIGPYDSMDYGCIMANTTGQAAAESIFTLVNTSYLPAGKYKLKNTWTLSAHDVEIVYSYINGDDNEVILATVDSEHEVVDFEITPEIITEGYRQRLYIRVKEGAEYGTPIYPLLTYGYVTDFDDVPNSYVRNNDELTQNVINLEDSTTNLQGRMLNVETGKQDKTQYAVMPAASADLLGKIYQYTGATNANYTQGHWYKCVENSGVYSWEDIGPNTPDITMTATVDNTTGTPTVSVTKTGTDAAPEFTFAFSGLKGAKGDTGNGIVSIEKTATSGQVDTYTITFTNGNTTTFTVSNGLGIKSADINANGHLIITYSDDTTYDAGAISDNFATQNDLKTKANIKPHYNLFPNQSEFIGIFLNNVSGHLYEQSNAPYNSTGFIDIEVGHTYKLVSSGNEMKPNFGLWGREMTDHNMTSGVTNLSTTLKPNDTFTATQNTIRFSYYASYEQDLKNYALVDIAETTDFYPYNDELTDGTTLGEAAIQQVVDVATSALVKPLYGKKILSLGDSFTYLNEYGKYLEAATGATQRGRGQNGNVLMSFCNDSYTGPDGKPVSETFDAELLAEYDIVTIMGGTNDYGHGTATLGSITDQPGDNTIYGSVKYLIDKILTIKPSIKIFFCTQPFRLQYGQEPAPGGYEANTRGLTMANIAEAIVKCCAYYGIPCFDFYSCSNWNPWTVRKEEGAVVSNIYTYDGLHPKGGDGNGADLLGTALGNFICQHWYY